MGPGAATIERRIISWMLGLVGWGTGESFSDARGPDGVLTHGGSLANLSALVAARRRIDPDAWQRGNPGSTFG